MCTENDKTTDGVEHKSELTGSVPPCSECGSFGYVPWDAAWAIRCSNYKCRLHQVGSVLTRKQWFEAAQNAKGDSR